MFARLASVRLKMAEHALRDGRLDEAYELATAADLRDHRRAQKVLCKLADRYLDRARRYAGDGRYTEALADLGKADQAGLRREEIAAIREQVLSTMQRVRIHSEERRQTLEVAGARIEAGSIAGGQRLLDRLDPASDVARLQRQAADREQSVRRVVDETRRLLEADRLAAAAESLRKAKTLYPRAEGLAELEATLCDAVTARVATLFDAGSLNRAADELAVLGELGRTLPARHELETIIALAIESARAVDRQRVPDAILSLRRLSGLVPKAAWVTAALEQLVSAQQTIDAVISGPLGAIHVNGVVAEAKRASAFARNTDGTIHHDRQPADAAANDATLPERLLVSVDAGGSYLLVRSPRVTIGRAGAKSTSDVPVFADLSDRHAEIARVGEDYFLFAKHALDVNGQAVTQKLLQDGDRIRLGRRGRMTFRQPSRMSASAVLDLSDGLRSMHDVRRIVLFDRHVLIGPHARCHLAARGAEWILFERGGGLWMRDADGPPRPGDEARAVPIGQYVGDGGCGISIRPWNQQASGANGQAERA